MTKKAALIFLLIASIPLVFYFGFWLMYIHSMNKAANRFYQENYVEKTLKGVVAGINEYEGNPYKIVLSIKNEGNEYDVRYGVTCVDKVFREHVSVGDSVFKQPDELYISFCSKERGCKDFRLNFCGKFKSPQ